MLLYTSYTPAPNHRNHTLALTLAHIYIRPLHFFMAFSMIALILGLSYLSQ